MQTVYPLMSGTKPAPDDRSVWFWAKMSEIYGGLWVKSFGKKPVRIWVKALAKFDDEQIKQGLGKCLKRKDATGKIDKFPPNLAEFVQLCKPEITHACHRAYIALPKPKSNYELARAELMKIRKFLKVA